MSEKVKIRLAKPFFEDDDINYFKLLVEKILRTGILTLGEYLSKFEKVLSQYTGSKYVIAMNSATSALYSSMLVLNVKEGDEVLVPAYTFASTINAPLYVNARPILIDSDINTFNLSLDDVLKKVKRGKTKAIIPVHIAGNPVDMKALMEIAQDYKLHVVEDAAHALGAFYKGKHAGTFGEIGILSFYPNKIITTGEGGAALTNVKEYAEKLMLIRNVGRRSLGPSDVITLGYNFRMSEINAALGLVQMRKIDYILNKRREIAKYYNALISKKLSDIVVPQHTISGGIPSYYAYIIRFTNTDINRDKVRYILREFYGIETTIIYRPVHKLTFYKSIFKNVKLPVAEFLGNTTIALPIHPFMTSSDVEYVIEALEKVVNALIKR